MRCSLFAVAFAFAPELPRTISNNIAQLHSSRFSLSVAQQQRRRMTSDDDDACPPSNHNSNGTVTVMPSVQAVSTVLSPLDDTLIFSSDSVQHHQRKENFERLRAITSSIAEFEGQDCIQLLSKDQLDSKIKEIASSDTDNGANEDNPEPTIISINSLLFQVTSQEPIVIIAPSADKVDTKKLEAYMEQNDDDERISVNILPSHLVESECGFPPMSVPPLGHGLRTIIDESLCMEGFVLLGGGGHPDYQCWIAAETLLRMEGTEHADIIIQRKKVDEEPAIISAPQEDELHDSGPDFPKPYFPLQPPDANIINELNFDSDAPQRSPFRPRRITLLGRVSGVRHLARRLAFVDLAPPDYAGTGSKRDSFDLPWRSGVDGQDMAVQLIAGKTFCKELGDIEGPQALKQFKMGRLILVDAKTNVGNRDSLRHWVEKRSLDLVVFGFQVIEENSRPRSSKNLQAATKVKHDGNAKQNDKVVDSQDYLKLSDLSANKDISVHIVDNLESAVNFEQDVHEILELLPMKGPIGLGLDCEWKPSFLLKPSGEAQPVTVLQLCFHPMDKVYILDTQTLFRSRQHPDEAMTDLEQTMSNALQRIFASKQVVKVGFQVFGDLQKLASSFPHVPCFRQYHSVVEISALVRKAMSLKRIPKIRQHISSLGKLCQYLLDNKTLNKCQQVSDWSERPLNEQQLEYAALDAAVSPVLLCKSMDLADAVFVMDDGLRIQQRGTDDMQYTKFIHSCRFTCVPNSDETIIPNLRPKQIVSKYPIVTQRWATAEDDAKPDMPI